MSEEKRQTNASSQEDVELIETFKRNDEAAFDKLVLKHKDRVFNLCYRFLGNYEEADDTAQEVFIKVCRSLKDFRFESSFSTWLYRISVNACKNKVKSLQYKYSQRMMRLDEPKKTEDSACLPEIEDKDASVIDKLQQKEKMESIQQAIDSLSEDKKTMVLLRDIEGLSYEEIAKITGYTLGTVKSKLARARELLREKLKGMI